MANTQTKHGSSPLSVRIDQGILEQLEALAEATGRTKSFLAAEAIERYLESESWQVQAVKQTIKKANRGHAHFVEHDKVSEWLNSWGTDEEQEPPK